jgi:glutathione S-transferase
MILYFARTLHSYKACAVARHTGLPITYTEVDLLAGENKSPAFLAMNPCGRTPVLACNDGYLWESNAIMCRLAIEARSNLWPDDAAQADVIRWLAWDAEHFKPYADTFYFEYIIKPAIGLGDLDEVAIERAKSLFHANAPVLENHLAKRDFLVRNRLSIADFAVAVTLPFAAQIKLPIDDYPAIRLWHDRLMDLPAWRSPFPTEDTGISR